MDQFLLFFFLSFGYGLVGACIKFELSSEA